MKHLIFGMLTWCMVAACGSGGGTNTPDTEASLPDDTPFVMTLMSDATEIRRTNDSTHLTLKLRQGDLERWGAPTMINLIGSEYQTQRVWLRDFVALFAKGNVFGDQPQQIALSYENPVGGPPVQLDLLVSAPVLLGTGYPYHLQLDVHTDWARISETVEEADPYSSVAPEMRRSGAAALHRLGTASIAKFSILGTLRHAWHAVKGGVLDVVHHAEHDIDSYVVGGIKYDLNKATGALVGTVDTLAKDVEKLGSDIENGLEWFGGLIASYKCDFIKYGMDILVVGNAVANATADPEQDVTWTVAVAAAKSAGKQALNELVGTLVVLGVESAGGDQHAQRCSEAAVVLALIRAEAPTATNRKGFYILMGKQAVMASNQCPSFIEECF